MLVGVSCCSVELEVALLELLSCVLGYLPRSSHGHLDRGAVMGCMLAAIAVTMKGSWQYDSIPEIQRQGSRHPKIPPCRQVELTSNILEPENQLIAGLATH